MATKEEFLMQSAQRKLQGASPVADTMHWIGEAGDDAKRLAGAAARKLASANQGMERDASRWDTMQDPKAMAQYQGPPTPVTAGGMARDMMDPAHMPMRPAASMGEAVQMAGALLPGGWTEEMRGLHKGSTPTTEYRFQHEGGTARVRPGRRGEHDAYVFRNDTPDQTLSGSHPDAESAFKWAQEQLENQPTESPQARAEDVPQQAGAQTSAADDMSHAAKQDVLSQHGIETKWTPEGRLVARDFDTASSASNPKFKAVDVTHMTKDQLMKWLGY